MVSVIIPAYNCAATLEKSIRSVLAQTCSDFEILIINDGSTDDTEEIALALSREDARIRCYTTENGGVSRARNFGIDHANGEYICFVDSDDTVEPAYLESMVSRAGEGVMPCVGYVINDSEQPYSKGGVGDRYLIGDRFAEDYFIGKLRHPIAYAVWNKLFSSAVLREKQIRFDERLRMGEDMLFSVQYLFCCDEIAYCGDALYHYRIYPASAVRRGQTDLLAQYEYILSRLAQPELTNGALSDDILCYWSLESLSVVLSDRCVRALSMHDFRAYCDTLFASKVYRHAIRCDKKCTFGRSLLRFALRHRSKTLLYLLLRGVKS